MPKTPYYFAGKTIIITGAAAASDARPRCSSLARAPTWCAPTSMRQGAKETAAQVNGKGNKALPLKTDVTRRKEVEEMAKRAIDAFGTVQFLFNSAGAAIRRAKFLDQRSPTHACKMGLEGIVSKRKASPYGSARSPNRLKMKNAACMAVKREEEERVGP